MDSLVTSQSSGLIDRARIESLKGHIGLGSGDEKSAIGMEPIKPEEIDIGAIKQVDGPRHGNQFVEDFHIMVVSLSDPNKGRDISL